MNPLTNCHGQPDPVLIKRADAWAVSPDAWRMHAGSSTGRVSEQRRRRVEERARVRWIPLSDGVRATLREARAASGLSPRHLDARLGQPAGFVWDVEHGYHLSIDPDVFALWLDVCQGTGEAVPA